MERENMYWQLLELGNYKGTITRELVQEKYLAQIKKIEQEEQRVNDIYGKDKERAQEHLERISSFKFGLNTAYQYCMDDVSIAIRNRITTLSKKPNASLPRESKTEESAKITRVRKDLRELEYLKNPDIMRKLLNTKDLNFDLLVPPQQPEEEMYYDIATGKISSERSSETSIYLAKRKNKVTDDQFSVIKRAIYDIKDKATGVKETQLTEYEVRRRKRNSITEESTILYGEIDFDKFEKDSEYRASFYRLFERARIEQNPYIGSLVDNKLVTEDSLEKNIARKLRKRELGEYAQKKQNEKSSDLTEQMII